MRNWQNSYKTLKATNWARKSIHHDVLLWDKEIPPSDLNNFSETRQSLVSDELFWSLGGISLSHNNTYTGYS